MENRHALRVRIDGEPFLSRAIAYRAEMNRVRDVAWEFAKARGATGIPGGMWGLQFPSDASVPVGWKARDRKGYSKPKKRHPDETALATLPRLPRSKDVFGDAYCCSLSYTRPNGDSGSGMIGWFLDGPSIGWAGETFFAVLPDPRTAIADCLKTYPDAAIEGAAATWKLPDGLTEISKAECDLIVASYEVEHERAAKAKVA